jgi:hypothetical protein
MICMKRANWSFDHRTLPYPYVQETGEYHGTYKLPVLYFDQEYSRAEKPSCITFFLGIGSPCLSNFLAKEGRR